MRLMLSIALVAACGGGGSAKSPDAGSIDAAHMADAAIDAPSGPVTLTVTNAGVGVMGITVYFQNADSTLVSEMTTDSSGSASAMMVAGGFVTALLPQSADAFQQVQIDTYADVKPGDSLVIDTPAAVVTQTVDFTVGSSGLGTGTAYTLFTTCPNSNPVSLVEGATHETGAGQISTTCTNANTSVWATKGPEILVATNTAVTIGANVNIATTYASPTAVTLSYTDVPAGITGIFASQALHTIVGSLEAPPIGELTVTAGAASGLIQQTTLAGSRAFTTTTIDYGAGEFSSQEIIELAPVSGGYLLDVGMNALHRYASHPVYAVASHSASWTEEITGVDPQFHVAELGISRTTGVSESWVWSMAVPRTGTTVTFPVLPTDVFDYNVGATDEVGVSLDGFKVPGGYDALRAFVFDNVDPVAELAIGGKATRQTTLSVVVSGRARANHRMQRW